MPVPLYEFRCPSGTATEATFPLAEVPRSIDCPCCAEVARRVFASPRLSVAGTAAYQLVDDAERSAHEPAVVRSPAPGTRSRRTAYTTNPLHQRLPRP